MNQHSNNLVFSKSTQPRILDIRGQSIILDSDLAKLYGVGTKRLNEQVKRNARRFPIDFIFQLTSQEKSEVVAKCDHLVNRKYAKSLPYAFTEHGAINVSGFALDPLMNMSKIKFPKPKMTHDRIKLYAQLECTSTFLQKTPYFKDYPFETLNNLADEKPISQFQNTKSVTLTDAGRQKAEQRKKQKLDCLPPHKSFMTAVN